MTVSLPAAFGIVRAPLPRAPVDFVELPYHARMLRRKRLVTLHEEAFLVDLAETVSLDDGDAFALADGRLVAVIAAAEPLMEVRGELARLAWHIGNRHAPCAVAADRLVIQRDRVLRAMLQGLGAQVTDIDAPFRPEGGAYGHGRTMGHSHAQGDHDGRAEGHDHDHDHGHDHGHGDEHGHGHDHGHHHPPGHPHAHDHDH
ncbi:MAG: urease accessory protein UreE [Rhodobacterales bacterium]|nr:urease accessory protein UreE [Rhodobacterales bacterium]NCT12152.1 urease accessory protein UreE [Rhodobacterales bacterium]